MQRFTAEVGIHFTNFSHNQSADLFNPCKPYEIAYSYQWEEAISNLMGVGLLFFSKF